MKRFWDKVDFGNPLSCWPWTASLNTSGYGQIRIDGKNVAAHRLVWESAFGELPAGMNVCHRCDNPPCVNPNHLFLGTQSDNMRDCATKDRANKPKGSAVHTSRLTADDVENIRANAMNLTQVALAELFGVSQASVSAILRRETWRHV